MATIVANPYYDDPFLSSIASNISRAFIDRNPGQTAAGRAQARLYGLQADELETKRGSRTKIAEQFRRLNGRAPTPEEYAVMTGDTIEGGLKPDDIASSNLFYVSNSGQPASNVARAVVGTGKTIGTNQGVTLEDRNEVAKRAEDEAARRSSIAAGPGYAGVAQREREANARLEYDKQYPEKSRAEGKIIQDYTKDNPKTIPSIIWKPVELSPGQTAVGVLDDPRMPSGTITNKKALPPFNLTPGGAALVPSDSPYSGAPVVSGPEKPSSATDINPAEVDAMEYSALQTFPGAVAVQGNTLMIAPSLNEDPAIAEARAEARLAASRVYSTTKDSERGKAEYSRVFAARLGIKPGAKYQKTGGVLGFGGTYGFEGAAPKSPVAGAVTSVPPPAAGAKSQSAPQQSVAPPPPNPADRKAGAVYTTPKGLMTWTGTGWVPADAK